MIEGEGHVMIDGEGRVMIEGQAGNIEGSSRRHE